MATMSLNSNTMSIGHWHLQIDTSSLRKKHRGRTHTNIRHIEQETEKRKKANKKKRRYYTKITILLCTTKSGHTWINRRGRERERTSEEGKSIKNAVWLSWGGWVILFVLGGGGFNTLFFLHVHIWDRELLNLLLTFVQADRVRLKVWLRRSAGTRKRQWR